MKQDCNKLTDKQERFCEEYMKDSNGAQAAIRAGYSAKCAKQISQENLTKPYLREYIDKKRAELAKDMDLSRKAQYKRLLLAYDMAVEQRSPTAIKAVLAEINEMLGYHREAAPNKEKEQALAQRMTREDKELATLAAKLRTEQEARAGLKLAGAG